MIVFKSLKNAVKQKVHWIARQPLHAIKYSSWGGGGVRAGGDQIVLSAPCTQTKPSSPNST